MELRITAEGGVLVAPAPVDIKKCLMRVGEDMITAVAALKRPNHEVMTRAELPMETLRAFSDSEPFIQAARTRIIQVAGTCSCSSLVRLSCGCLRLVDVSDYRLYHISNPP